MSKKIIAAMVVLILAISASIVAGQQGIHEPGTGLTNPEVKEAAQGTGQGLETADNTSASTSAQGIHTPGTGIVNPEVKEAAQEAAEGSQAQAGQPATAPETSAQKTQPGFEAIVALTGLIAVASIVLRRRS